MNNQKIEILLISLFLILLLISVSILPGCAGNGDEQSTTTLLLTSTPIATTASETPIPASTPSETMLTPTPFLIRTPEIKWKKQFSGNNKEWVVGSCIEQTTDGGYIIAGTTESYGAGLDDFWIIKTNDCGEEEWSRTFGGKESDRVYSITQTVDGGFIATGATNSHCAISDCGISDVWVVKMDSSGEEEWSRTFGGKESDRV